MRIIHSRVIGSENRVSDEQMLADTPRIMQIFREELKKGGLWEFFGGVITIEDREYQVA